MAQPIRLAILALIVACGAPGQRGPRPNVSGEYLSRDEIAARSADDMLSLIRSLRPNWLMSPPGGSSASAPGARAIVVFLDGRELGTPLLMKSISSEAVEYARYYRTAEAQSRYGPRIASPVIDITSRKP